MKLRVTPLIAALFLACCATQAHAAKYPPGPGGTCTDTLTNFDVQHSATCRPGTACAGFGTGGAVGCDSVFGVKGIITGIKNNGTSRTFYMQSRRSDLQYTGMDVFNGNGLSNANVQIGDSVAVSGKTEEGFKKTLPGLVLESGETEISGFDASSATVSYVDLPVNILSSGNSLPALHTLSIADIRFPACDWNSSTPNASAASGEPWESCLVRLVGPLVVGRRAYDGAVADPPVNCTTCPTYPGIETRLQSGLHGGGMLCYLEGNPTDSIYIDMTSFVTMTPPAVGTKIDSVYGILQQGGRAGSNSISSWRIAVRSSAPSYTNTSTADLFLATPPEVSDAYPVADDSVRVEFDRAVTEASVTVPGHYTLDVSARSVDYAHAIGDNAVVCHIVGAYPVGDPDSVTCFGQTGKVNGLTQSTIKGKKLINGVLSIPMIQAPDPDSLVAAGGCIDRSKYSGPGLTDGPRLSFSGVVTGRFFTREYYIQDEAGGPRSGMKVFQPSAALTIGHKYLLATGVTEFAGETEANGPRVVQDLGTVSPPALFSNTLQVLDDFACDNPPGISTLSVTNGEDYEGCLVEINHSVLVGSDAATFVPGGFFHVTDATPPRTDPTDIEINFGADLTRAYTPAEGDFLSVKGILSYRTGQGVLFPRGNGDVVKTGNVDVGSGTIDRVRFAAHPNPAPAAELAFALPRRDNVELAIFDLAGRRVATLARGVFEPGAYSKRWEGRDDRGRLVGSGIYLYRLRVGKETFILRGVRLQ